ncbi:uncharacterized protein LOC124152660 [Haliotis rufescens]|uniref:uncharacterized protein LOC124152660 n=1 Tax=Haliotis rufescens TaxID=6454 RepID=UPI00201F174C|nr:uncharacterized protein LOC124152660 [Haliotis rufescens]
MPSTTLEVEEHQVSAPVADRDSSGTASAVDQKRVLRSRSKEEPPAEHQYARKRTRERLSKTPKLDCGAKLRVRETLCFPYEKDMPSTTLEVEEHQVSAPVADRDSSGTASAVDQKRVLRSRSKVNLASGK